MKDSRLVFATGYVGGYGGVAKVRRALNWLAEQKQEPLIVTESSYVPILEKFGITPDLVVPFKHTPEENYEAVKTGLEDFTYDTLVSFGPRTYWPADAVQRGKKAVIIDGGLPPFSGNETTDHWQEIYQQLAGTFSLATSHGKSPQKFFKNTQKFLLKYSLNPWIHTPSNNS